MKWVKKGLIYQPDKRLWWSQNYGILPTPVYNRDQDTITVYFASTDQYNFGHLSYLVVSAENPAEVLYRHTEPPLLGPGEPGAFDDCGINPSCFLPDGKNDKLFYIGYQRSYRTPYSIFAGLALKQQDGTFKRYSKLPVLDRTEDELSIRSATTIIREESSYAMWYVSATRWEKMTSGLFAGKLMPNYIIRKATSEDGIKWGTAPGLAIDYQNNDEFGFGRPWVLKDSGVYRMWYSVRKRNTSYRIGYAESVDGQHWVRLDNQIGLDISDEGWDSEMVCYPAVVKVGERYVMFYNGNDNGKTGFGVAEMYL